MSDFLKLVGNKIRLVRKAKGLTQEDLAERCNLQYTYIGGVERGVRNVSLQTLEKLAKGLDVAPFELLKFEELDLSEIPNDKQSLVEVYKHLLLNRDEEEIKLLQRITKDILDLLDKKTN